MLKLFLVPIALLALQTNEEIPVDLDALEEKDKIPIESPNQAEVPVDLDALEEEAPEPSTAPTVTYELPALLPLQDNAGIEVERKPILLVAALVVLALMVSMTFPPSKNTRKDKNDPEQGQETAK